MSRAHVLVVPVPGYPLLPMRVEAAITHRGWQLATAPADADLLVLAGEPGSELAQAVDGVWEQVPHPRWRAQIVDQAGIERALTESALRLLDRGERGTAPSHSPKAPVAAQLGHGGTSMGEMDHSAMDHGDMSMGGMDMTGPGGIPLASGDDGDRDGLEMDVLHLPLGPVLPDWPAGLVVETVLRGDVIAEATSRVLPGTSVERDPLPPASVAALVALDGAARVLRLAGDRSASAATLRLRDDLLRGGPVADRRARVGVLRRRIARSPALRWSLRSLDPAGDVDARARLLHALDVAAGAAEPNAPLPLARLDGLLPGRGLADARLLVTAADVDVAVVAGVADE